MNRGRQLWIMALVLLLTLVQITPVGLNVVHAETVLLEDDFESYSESPVGRTWINSTKNGNWVLDTEGSSQVLKLDSAGTTFVIARGNVNWSDYTHSAKIKITGIPTEGTVRAGIAARHTNKENYYTLMVRRSTKKDYLLLTRRVDNKETTLAEVTLSDVIDPDTIYHLKFELSGNVLKGYVDNELKIEETDDMLHQGSIGLYSNSKSNYTGAVWFDDVIVTGDTEPVEEDSGTISVSTSEELNDAIQAAIPGTTIELADGAYEIEKISNKHGTEDKPIVIKAANPGKVDITGRTLYIENSSYLVFQGLNFRNSGYYGVRLTNNHHIRLTENRFELPPNSGSSTWVQIDGAYSHHNRIDHNVFENKRDPGKFIVIGGDNPGFTGISKYDRIDHNIFRNTLSRQTNESEPIRVGESKLSLFDSHTIIEHNWFEHTDSDPEIISIKSGKNIIRYNTFYESLGSLTLRHGNGSLVYGNRFIGNGRTGMDQEGKTIGTGGIRIYGDDHLIFNNYFYGLTGTKWDAAITITNGDADYDSSTDMSKHFRPRNIQIVHNTFVDNDYTIELGYTNNGKYNLIPKNVTIANNIVVGSRNRLISIHSHEEEIMEHITWEGNIMYPRGEAELGVSVEPDQINVIDPLLVDHQNEYIKIPASNSPALNAAVGNYSFVYEEDHQRSSANHVGAYEGHADEPAEPGEDEGEKAVPNRLEVVAVEASSHDGNFPQNVLDDDLTTRWSAKSAVDEKGNRLGEWLLLDLGSEQTVSYLGIAFYNGDQRKTKFDIEVSTDKENWKKVYSGESSGTTATLEAFDFEDTVARYIRFIGYGNTSNEWNSLLEVHVYGPSSDGSPVLEDIGPPKEEERGDTTPYTKPGLYEPDGTPHPVHTPNPVTGKTLNVTNYGAVPDDGKDDMAAIEAALNDANPGDEIYFPDGVYDLIGTWSNDGTSQIVLKSKVNIRGESETGTVLKSHFDRSTANSKVIRAYGQHDIVISDLTITSTFSGPYSSDHEKNNQDRGGPEYGIYLEDSSGEPSYNITIENVTIEKFQKMGVRISKSHDVVVRNATFRNATDVGGGGAGYGISIQGVPKVDRIGYANDTKHNLVEKSTFQGPYLRHGVIIQFYAHNNEIRDNVFEGTQLDAIDLHGEQEYMNKIYNNKISGVLTGAGIALGNTGGTPPSNHSASGADNYILNNTISNSREGIKVHMGTPNTLIEGNMITNTTQPSSPRGILIQNAPGTIIKNNKITNNTAEEFWGILLEYDPGDPKAGNVGSGIPKDVKIIGNIIMGNTNGVRIAAGENIVLENNTITGNLNTDFEDLRDEGSEPEEEWIEFPTDDAKIDIDRPDENYGVEDPEKIEKEEKDRYWYRLFNVKANADFTFGRIAYMKFEVPDSESIKKAILELYARTGSNTASVTLDVYGLTNDDWSEETITWNNSPNHEPDRVKVTRVGETAFYIDSFTINSKDKTKYIVDVTEFVKQQTDGYVTFMIIDTIGQNGNVNILSKEDSDPNMRPILRMKRVTEQNPEKPEYPLQISRLIAEDFDGTPLSELNDASFVRVQASVKNLTDSPVKGTMIIALYRPDGNIARMAYSEQLISAGDNIILGGGFDLPEDTSGYVLKVFVWDDLEQMIPLTEPYHFKDGQFSIVR